MEFTSVGIYAGIGAPLLGTKWAGFKVLGNHEPRGFFDINTFNYNFSSSYHSRELTPLHTRPTLVIGNPSCNIFSSLSTRKKHLINEDTITDTDFYKAGAFIDRSKPLYFVIENIPKILKHITIEADQVFFNDLPNLPIFKGYTISHAILNSYHFGVPQKRKRVFIVGTLADEPVGITKKRQEGVYHVGQTIKEAFENLESGLPNSKLPSHSQKRKDGFDKLTPGDSYYGTQNNRRLFLNEPSGVVTSSCSRAVHPTEPRTLTVRETATLMGYPPDFTFFGGMTSQLDQVGKAIVPQVAFSISLDIRTHLKWHPQLQDYMEE